MTLRESMELGGQCLLAWLDSERDFLPTGSFAITHDLARWWDAILRLENATGFPIPAHMEGASLRNLHWLLDNPDGLLFVPPGLDWHKMKFEFHSMREGILTFAALVQFRNNRWAREAGHKYLCTIQRGLTKDFSWDVSKFEYSRHFTGSENEHPGHTPANANRSQKTVTHGRCIEALVWFYKATGDCLALELAEHLARFHLNYVMEADGSIPVELGGDHSPQGGDRQSYFYTLSGLLLYGVATGQSEYVDAVVRAYSTGAQKIINGSGWVAHDLGKLQYPDKTGNPLANTESTGAAARLALWIACHTGRAGCYDDVERLVRARLSPGQTTQADIRNNPDVEVPPKYVGGWGANDYPHAGKGCNPSGTAEIVHTLTSIYQRICTRDKVGLAVHMLFDYEDEKIRIETQRGERAILRIKPWIEENLLVRIPRWVPDDSIDFQVNGMPVSPSIVGSYAFIPSQLLRQDAEITLSHDLPTRRSTETMPAGDTYEFAWRGDEIVGIHPNDRPMPFYPSLV